MLHVCEKHPLVWVLERDANGAVLHVLDEENERVPVAIYKRVAFISSINDAEMICSLLNDHERCPRPTTQRVRQT